MNKVEFKQFFDIGYQEITFTANNEETFISIISNYSVPSSMVSSAIFRISGKLFEENISWFFFSELVEIESDVNANVFIELERFEIDPEDFDEEEFFQHLIDEATEKIQETDLCTTLKDMEVV
ncbi:hypothetical protein FG384_07530 [Psychrobacillus vulpis]|uniref:Uncharacterized protein n=1 Tax=Psychrobacillus vulpis TaxID=2325572 RepID=A0A544TSJ0_9BACI|nr:hypothetical protein FG384_07530 [Psychrobacillus vulpis]